MLNRENENSAGRQTIAKLAAGLAFSFILLACFDRSFFLIHLYEAQIYLVIVLVYFLLDDRWLYAFGTLAPVGWLLIGMFTSGFGSILRQLERLLHLQEPNYPAIVLGIIASCLSLVIATVSARAATQALRKLGHVGRTTAVSVAIILAYDAGLLYWFRHLRFRPGS